MKENTQRILRIIGFFGLIALATAGTFLAGYDTGKNQAIKKESATFIYNQEKTAKKTFFYDNEKRLTIDDYSYKFTLADLYGYCSEQFFTLFSSEYSNANGSTSPIGVIDCRCTIYSRSANINQTFNYISITRSSSGNSYLLYGSNGTALSRQYFGVARTSATNGFYYLYSFAGSGVSSVDPNDYITFYIDDNDNSFINGVGVIAEWLLEEYQSYSPEQPDTPDNPTTITGDTFTFDNQINYYAPYQQNISSMFASDSNMTTAGTIQSKTLIEGLTFVSGGQTFDTIRLYYESAEAEKFINDTGNITTFTSSGFASYGYMVYLNSETNTLVVVNTRDRPTYTDNSSTAVIQTKGSTWVSQSYRTIVFIDPLTEANITTLGTLNNASIITPSATSVSDVGLGNVFTLLSSGFTAWLPVLSIQLVPGITIGLLLFLPLIVGIIVLVVWIVKR